jgi:signal transduction histidine kinase
VRIAMRREGGEIAVSVEDRGIGISSVDRPHVFERYFRGSNTAGIVGSGVGLYLVKTIVELHGGSIQLDSHEHRGSRFTLRLPACMAHAVTARPSAVCAVS